MFPVWSLVAFFWSRVFHSNDLALISSLPFDPDLNFVFRVIILPLFLSLFLGVAITLACFIGFRTGLRTAFGSDALPNFFVEKAQQKPETTKAVFPAVSEPQVET